MLNIIYAFLRIFLINEYITSSYLQLFEDLFPIPLTIFLLLVNFI